MKQKTIALCAAIALAATACKSESKSASSACDTTHGDSVATSMQAFSADSAFSYLCDQVSFGPRPTGSEANVVCREYIADKLRSFGVDTVYFQPFTAHTFDGKHLDAANVFASVSPELCDRVLLVAHYDTRPWADNEALTDKRNTPIEGANDGGSGVAVLLELARGFAARHPKIGVDLLFVDAEDYGDSGGWELKDDTWCLGSQYFARHQPYTNLNRPHFGIVLDMVGGLDARFHREYFSEKYAPAMVDRIWNTASRLGYSNRFINQLGGSLIDDHIPLSKGGIPTVDIVECNNNQTGGFPPTWHTTNDNLSNISTSSLKTVGDVVNAVIYDEMPAVIVNENNKQCHDY